MYGQYQVTQGISQCAHTVGSIGDNIFLFIHTSDVNDHSVTVG